MSSAKVCPDLVCSVTDDQFDAIYYFKNLYNMAQDFIMIFVHGGGTLSISCKRSSLALLA